MISPKSNNREKTGRRLFGNRGRPLFRCFPFLPGFGSFLDSPASGVGGVLPIGNRARYRVFAPRRIRATMIVMGVVGVAGLVAAGAPSRPNRPPRVMSPDSKPGPCLGHRIHNDPKPGKNGKQRTAPCFQRVVSLFSLCYLLLEKSSKSLMPLSDCPFVLNGAVAELVGNEGGVVSGVFNLESSGVEASDWRPRHDEHYHEA
jgi:hypothetical protein